ncbi:MAG: hypothetical protein ABH834_01160 [Candidatus Altiarchaeota archaeon]
MDSDLFMIGFFSMLLGFFGGWIALTDSLPQIINEPVGAFCPSCMFYSNLSVYYLYPSRCMECERNIPPTCDGCNQFYDLDLLSTISGDIGVPISFVVSDAVSDASLFVVYGNEARLGLAKSKISIAQSICSVSGNENACALFAEHVEVMEKCFGKYGVSADTVIYHYGDSCAHCEDTLPYVEELSSLSYGDVPYKVKFLSEDVVEEKRVLTECVGGLLELRYVPQVICPGNGRTSIGAMDLTQLRDFADECIISSQP